MMSSGKTGSSGMRVPRRSPPKQGKAQYIMFAVVAILVITIVLVVAFGGRRGTSAKAPQRTKSVATRLTETGSAASRGSREQLASRASRRDRSKKESTRDFRERRRRERAERRTVTRTSTRSSRGGYTARRSGTPVLQAIISQPDGERVAVVGNRQVKKGDLIEGRRITEVGPDRVKVEYFTKTYEVRLNQPIY